MLIHSSMLGLARMLLASSMSLVDICIHILLLMITRTTLRTYPELNKFVFDLDEAPLRSQRINVKELGTSAFRIQIAGISQALVMCGDALHYGLMNYARHV